MIHCSFSTVYRSSQCLNVTDYAMSSLLIGCPKLQNIRLSECTRISKNSVLTVAEHFRRLRNIDMSNCSITDAVMIALTRGCPQLSSIALSHFHDIADAGIIALGQSCPLKSRVDLYQRRNITDVGITALAQGCPLLRVVILHGCDVTHVSVSGRADLPYDRIWNQIPGAHGDTNPREPAPSAAMSAI